MSVILHLTCFYFLFLFCFVYSLICLFFLHFFLFYSFLCPVSSLSSSLLLLTFLFIFPPIYLPFFFFSFFNTHFPSLLILPQSHLSPSFPLYKIVSHSTKRNTNKYPVRFPFPLYFLCVPSCRLPSASTPSGRLQLGLGRVQEGFRGRGDGVLDWQ